MLRSPYASSTHSEHEPGTWRSRPSIERLQTLLSRRLFAQAVSVGRRLTSFLRLLRFARHCTQPLPRASSALARLGATSRITPIRMFGLSAFAAAAGAVLSLKELVSPREAGQGKDQQIFIITITQDHLPARAVTSMHENTLWRPIPSQIASRANSAGRYPRERGCVTMN